MNEDGEKDRVIKLDLGYVPEAAISGPFLMQSDNHAVLTFNAMRPRSDGMREDAGTAIVRFDWLMVTRFGYPNDEALDGHPLYSRGLGAYAIFEVLESSWIAQLDRQNRVNFPNADIFRGMRHFVIVFHESVFECIARNIEITVGDEPFIEIVRTLVPEFDS